MARHREPFLLLLFLLVAPLPGGPAAAQPRFMQGQPEESRRVFYEPLCLPADDTLQVRVDILYRIDREFLISFRNPDSAVAGAFRRRGEVMIELLDSTGISRAREIRRIDAGEPEGEQSSFARRWFAGVASFTVPPGRYAVSFEVDDLESDRKFQERSRSVEARPSGASPLTPGGTVLLADVPADGEAMLLPQNFGDDVLFGTTGALALQLRGVLPDSLRFSYSLSIASPSAPEDGAPVIRDTLITPMIIPGILKARGNETDTVWYSISAPGFPGVTVAVVPLPLQRLPLRSYEFHGKLLGSGSPVEISRRFRMVWPTMPQSLRDVDAALDALRLVTTADQLDSLREGSFEARVAQLEGFWAPKDPTPATAYNEVMTEYYRRVDHTVRAFGTLREPDGSRTDRGRIYILHGPPARTERTLDPAAGFREMWTYESPQKRFTFVDKNRTGMYTLVSP